MSLKVRKKYIVALQYHQRLGRGTWWLSSITSGDVQVPSGSPVSLEVSERYLVTPIVIRGEMVPSSSLVSLEVRYRYMVALQYH